MIKLNSYDIEPIMNDYNKSKEELILELKTLREDFESIKEKVRLENLVEKERRKQDILSQSEAIYKSILEASPDVITIADLHGNILLTSPRVTEMYGLSQTEDIKGLTVFDFLDEKDHENAINLMTKMYEGPQGTVEYLAKRRDGTLFEVEVNSDFIRDSKGKPVDMLIIQRDVSQKKRVEEKLRKSEKTYKNLIESINDVIYEIAADGTIKYISPSIEKIIGYTAEELIGTNVFRIVYQEDRAGLLKRLEDNNEQRLRFFDLRFVSKDGNLSWARSLPSIVTENGVVVGRKGILSDITQQKLADLELSESEKKYRSIFENIQDVYYEVALDGTILEISPSIEQFSNGLYKREEAIGLSMFDLYTNQEDREQLHNQLRKYGRVTDFEIALLNRDDSIIYCLYSAKLVTDPQGNPVKVIGSIHNIAERKKAEIALKESEASLNYAQEVAKMGSWEHNLVTNKMTCSRNYCKVMGLCAWEGDDHLYDRFIQTVVPEDIQLVEYLQQTNYTENKTEQVDIRIFMPDGTIRWIQNNVNPVFKEGKLVALKGVNIDVTEQRLNEEKIRHQNERLKAILEAIPDLIFVATKDGSYTEYYSSETDRLTVPDDQIIGKNIRNLFDEETATLHLKKIDECIEKQAIVTYEFSGVAKDKEIFFEVRLAPFGNDRVLTVARDITDRKKNEEILRDSEEKYRYMFFNNPQPMWIYDLETLAFLEVNEAAIKHYGYTRAEFLSMTLKDIRPEEDIDNLLADIKDTKRSLDTAVEWRHLKKNGELIHVEIVSHFVTFNGRNARHILVNDVTVRKQIEQEIRDLNANLEIRIKERTVQLEQTNNNLLEEIEVRKQIEEEIKKARTEAEQANIAKSEFLSRMSHELRTPLNSILGFAQLLQMGELPPSKKKGVKHIIQSGKHLLDLINEVLDISRIEAGHLTLSLEPILLYRVITEITNLIKPLCHDKQITLEQFYYSDKQIFVNSDYQRLKQILLNLLNNAIKYNKQTGSISIKVEKKQSNSNGSVPVRISITDTGFGISANDIPKLFTPFERIGAEKLGTEGTGLGLAVVKKLLDAMGGSIGVESELGNGSTFWFELPYIENQHETINGQGSLVNSESGDCAITGKILYIEDNVSNVELIDQILSGYRPGLQLITDIHGNSAEGLAILHHPDLILLDLDLPDIHGSEVLRQLKGNKKTMDIPVIIVSADAMSHQLERLMKLGAANYLTKPIDVINFLSVIDKVIEHNPPLNQ